MHNPPSLLRLSYRIVLLMSPRLIVICFFFQAEDGIRDLTVTGVQTCALPIYAERGSGNAELPGKVVRTSKASLLLRVPRSAFRVCQPRVRQGHVSQRKPEEIGRASCRERV